MYCNERNAITTLHNDEKRAKPMTFIILILLHLPYTYTCIKGTNISASPDAVKRL